MDADQLTQEFCGSCHRSAEEVAANRGLHGLTSVRFQPYRLFTSKGHDPFDKRISCVACHDPHEESSEHDLAYYDTKCLTCHQTTLKVNRIATPGVSAAANKPCPVSQKDCVTCHMPKISLEGAHFNFTDHRIRIARLNEPFPN
jgi:predicted CXXCH cytochrome family protein